MSTHPRAGRPAQPSDLVDIGRLVTAYYTDRPDPSERSQRVAFRPSGHRGRRGGLADGIVVAPSHNPPDDGGIKYNPPHGGPADQDATGWIQDRANALVAGDLQGVARVPYERARRAPTTRGHDFLGSYVDDLPAVVDLDAVREAGVWIGVDPLGGASVAYWGRIAERHRLDLTVVNQRVDGAFSFMTLDWDGKIRMGC